LALDEFLLPLEIAAFDEPAAEGYGTVRAALEKAGTPIGPLDTQIGAHALSLGATLVTHNTREFRRVPGLAVADWL
ncbi:MAG: type II toxin-antitoxin system VapC family toxin, partial [Candidatus Aminicenantes bacterium]|nr:type II toxin-antitoxin system VapC family toxin [Candidatus Aminicenantes bacterium]